MALIQKICSVCNKEFFVPSWRERTATTCSQQCRSAGNAARHIGKRGKVICKGCGKTFLVPPSHVGRRIYCSAQCAAPGRANPGNREGEKHYRWNGGKSEHCDGYRYVAVHGHPFTSTGNYVLEHRVVMEAWLREVAPEHEFLMLIDGAYYLRPEIEVHHINEVKHENRRKNLLACTAPAHRAIHNGVAPMQGEVWPEIEGLQPFRPRVVRRICELCGKPFLAKRCDVDRGGGKFCSKKCFKERDRTKFKVIVT